IGGARDRHVADRYIHGRIHVYIRQPTSDLDAVGTKLRTVLRRTESHHRQIKVQRGLQLAARALQLARGSGPDGRLPANWKEFAEPRTAGVIYNSETQADQRNRRGLCRGWSYE